MPCNKIGECMKKNVFLAMLFFYIPLFSQPSSFPGEGTKDSPYEIWSEAFFQELANFTYIL